MSDDHKQRFTEEHKDFINFSFEKYYAIDKYSSLTDAAQFERFCQFIDIRCERVYDHPLFNYDRLEAVYLTTEYSFDPILIGEFYKQKIKAEKNIEVFNFHKINNVEKTNTSWEINLESLAENNLKKIKASALINATYSGSNAVNQQFGVADILLMHEISEIAFITSPQLNNIGLTVMDGQFGSVMPYGKSGLLSLSSVAYTHHKVCYDNLPTFDCQKINKNCTPEFSAICNFCEAKPRSNYRKMIAQMQRYFSDHVQLNYLTSYFTIKTKLKANHIDDGRPTEINRLHEKPDFYCIFAGKINSIYEIEKVVS